jgi:hypothetical protein
MAFTNLVMGKTTEYLDLSFVGMTTNTAYKCVDMYCNNVFFCALQFIH